MARKSLRKKLKKPKNVILIITEGETEEAYLEGFRQDSRSNGKFTIQLKNPPDSDCGSLLDYCFRTMDFYKLDVLHGDRVFCVCDSPDKFTDEIRKNLQKAQEKGVELILTNPCIELWFLLHYKKISNSISSNNAINGLTKYIPDYLKGSRYDTYSKLKPKTEDALKNVKTVEIKGQITQMIPNPGTNMNKLVILLRELINNKR